MFSIGLGALLAISVASPSFAYGKENWQITFAGTGIQPTVGNFGFWGWCALSGGVTSGNNGDCELAQYVHMPSSSFTCEESVDVSGWHTGPGVFPTGDFFFSGDVTVHPGTLSSAQLAECIGLFPGSTPFSNVDTQIPAAAGHYNLNSLVPVVFGTSVGQFQIQVAQIP
jgi:hypothetical protein